MDNMSCTQGDKIILKWTLKNFTINFIVIYFYWIYSSENYINWS